MQTGPIPSRAITRLYIRAGVVWQLGINGYWLLFWVRAVVDLHLDPLELVLLGTAKEVAVLASEIPTGVVADIYSRKWSVVLAFAFSGVSVALAGLLGTFELLLISSALWGFSLTFRSGAETAWLTDELGSPEAAEPVVIHRAKIELTAVVVSTVLAAGLAVVTSLSIALTALGVLLVAAAVYLALEMPERGFEPVRSSRTRQFMSLLVEGARGIRRVTALRVLFIVTVLAGFGSEAIDRLYVQHVDNLLAGPSGDLETVTVGAVLVVQATTAAVVMQLLNRRLGGARIVPVLGILYAVVAAGIAVFAGVDTIQIAAVGLIVQGAMRAVSQPVVVAWTNANTKPRSRATIHSFIGQAHSVGEITGGIVLGVLATKAGLPAALAGSAAMYAIASLVTLAYRRHRGRGSRPR
ncbi:MAG: MFS transporter [Acidimicrobiia bacterium]|jgi:DHA3 family tetracycline resistance protein-like MFS transporter